MVLSESRYYRNKVIKHPPTKSALKQARHVLKTQLNYLIFPDFLINSSVASSISKETPNFETPSVIYILEKWIH